jgi:glutamate racemase
MDQRPVGVFDSGVGGLSVLRAIRQGLPAERVIYVADSGYAPYGDRPREFIESRAIALADYLVSRDAKAIVVACNTATGAAAHVLRSRFSLPIVAMEPAVKPAALHTKSGIVGVLATTSTLASAKFLDLVDRHGAGVQVLVQPCPGLVEQVEAGELDTPRTRAMVESLVRPLLARGADTLVLGCTHYPFLRHAIEDVAGAGVTVIDPADAVARELHRRLDAAGLLASEDQQGSAEFLTTGPLDQVRPVISQLWSHPVDVRPLTGTPGAGL